MRSFLLPVQSAIVFAKVQDQATQSRWIAMNNTHVQSVSLAFIQIVSYISRHIQCIYLERDIILAIEHVVRLVFGRDTE